MTAVPAFMPVMLPELPIVMLLLVVLHVPPVTASVAVIVAPWHTVAGPPIVVGVGFTINVSFTEQIPVL